MAKTSLKSASPRGRSKVEIRDGSSIGHGVRENLEKYALLIAWAVLIIAFSVLRPKVFPTVANFSSMLGSNAVLAMLALGLIIVLRAGDFDLSIAANMTFCGVLLGVLTVNVGMPLLPALVISLVAGAVVGAINAFIVLVLNVDSFITTLGMSTLLTGFTLWLSNSQTITGLPQALIDWVVVTRVFSIPIEFFYALLVMAVLWYVFRYTAAGRRILFVGKNKDVARLSGVRVPGVRFWAFVSSGLISGLAGVLYAGTSGSVDPTSGLNYLLPAFAAAFLGATCIEVGEFNPLGTVLAVYFLVTGTTGLAILGVPSFIQQIFYGAALIIAVAGARSAAKSKQRAIEAEMSRANS